MTHVDPTPNGEIALYEGPDGMVRLDGWLEREMIWLTEKHMAELFDTSTDNGGALNWPCRSSRVWPRSAERGRTFGSERTRVATPAGRAALRVAMIRSHRPIPAATEDRTQVANPCRRCNSSGRLRSAMVAMHGMRRGVSSIGPIPSGEIALYEAPDGQVRLNVRVEQDAVWLTQAQMAELFGRERSVITRHVNNVFGEGELTKESNVQKLHVASSDKPVVAYRDHVLLGYTLNERDSRENGLFEMEQAVGLLSRTFDHHALITDEGRSR